LKSDVFGGKTNPKENENRVRMHTRVFQFNFELKYVETPKNLKDHPSVEKWFKVLKNGLCFLQIFNE